MSERISARRFANTTMWSALGGGAVLALAVALREPYAPARNLLAARASGWCAVFALAASLSIGPLRGVLRALRQRTPGWLAALRRRLGIVAAVSGTVHSVYALSAIAGLWQLVLTWAWLRAGLGALLVLLALLATSFDAVVRRLRLQAWKPLHRLAYLAACLSVVHVALGPFGTPSLEAALALYMLGLLCWRLVPARWLRQPLDERD